MAFPVTQHNNKAERIGRMRHRIHFIAPTTAIDAIGSETHVWATSLECWAHVEGMMPGSQDSVIADRITNVNSSIATMRYNSAVDPKHKMVHDGNEWEILSILPDIHKSYMTLEVRLFDTSDYLIDDEGDPLIDDDGDTLNG